MNIRKMYSFITLNKETNNYLNMFRTITKMNIIALKRSKMQRVGQKKEQHISNQIMGLNTGQYEKYNTEIRITRTSNQTMG